MDTYQRSSNTIEWVWEEIPYNGLGWKGPKESSSNPPDMALEQAAQGPIQPVLEHLQ